MMLPTQLDRPAEHYQREQQPHPTREQRPAQHSLIISKPSRTAVPFNRLQLAAALIEYNDHQSSDAQISAIDWDIQELSSKPLATIKQAPYSAIFIPFRQSLPSKPPDFFSDIQLPASPKTPEGKSLSGFGLVSEIGASRLPRTIPGHTRRISEPVIIEDAAQATADRPGIDDDTEVLSEWGLDKVLAGNPETEKSLDQAQEPELAPNAEPKTGRDQEKNLEERLQVKSDMFDFQFSEVRLQNEEEDGQKTGKSFTPDFFDNQITSDQLNPVIDDEAMLRQRFGCDPEGRKLLRPQSVLELEETRQRYRQTKTSTTKQLAALRGRAPHPQQGVFEINPNDPSRQTKIKPALRTKSLSPTRAVGRASMSALRPTISKINSIDQQHSGPDGIQTIEGLATNSLPARGRRKSVLDEPSNRRFSINPLQNVLVKRLHQRRKSTDPSLPDTEPSRAKKSSANSATDDLSGPISPNQINSNSISELKSKRRTSADIAERYQKSIAMLEGRKSEDMTYDVPNQLSASLSGSMGG
ncbi:hypothetical protein Pst134EA_002582 [Puccinia striiformis f. sp. tritici]|nr:hypothetical protein Pst134EA_002582 [Puccinia striiformis f. sp. tritici]KAH9471953.1 hypothetical protein Pst134EA_002582 [Puccinia striiformis f. sp. tritici]